MNVNDYQEGVLKTASPMSMATPENLLLQAVMGMCGEAGEAIDIVKKVLFQGHQLNDEEKKHFVIELGDVLWYVTTGAVAIGYDLEEVMQMNIDKLKARYGDEFSVEGSVNRREGDM